MRSHGELLSLFDEIIEDSVFQRRHRLSPTGTFVAPLGPT